MATQCQTISFQELTVVALLLQNVQTCALACASSQETCCMCNACPKETVNASSCCYLMKVWALRPALGHMKVKFVSAI